MTLKTATSQGTLQEDERMRFYYCLICLYDILIFVNIWVYISGFRISADGNDRDEDEYASMYKGISFTGLTKII